LKLKKVKNVDKLIFVFLLLLVYGIFTVINTGVPVDEFSAKLNFAWIAVCAFVCFALIIYRRGVERTLIKNGTESLKRNIIGIVVVSVVEAFLYLVFILMLVMAAAVFFGLTEPVNIFIFGFPYLWVVIVGIWVIIFGIELREKLVEPKKNIPKQPDHKP